MTNHTFQPVLTPASPVQEIVNTLTVDEIIDIYGIIHLTAIMTDRDALIYMRHDRWADLWSVDPDDDEIPEPPVRTLPSGEIPRYEFRVPLQYRKPDRKRDRRRS